MSVSLQSSSLIALAGLPNSGKTSLFNALTGSRQKVANYPGVTVERKEGAIPLPDGRVLRVLDLPGTYSLDARTPDEEITRDVLLGRIQGEAPPAALIVVVDATNLERNLGLVLELRELKVPLVLALNMMDLAKKRGLDLDLETFSNELQIPVIPTVAVKNTGTDQIVTAVNLAIDRVAQESRSKTKTGVQTWSKPEASAVRDRFNEVDRILRKSTRRSTAPSLWTERLDRLFLHPIFGLSILALVLALIFQAIFSWASLPADWIESGVSAFGVWVGSLMADGPLKDLLVNGVISGVGSVVVFLPQILILFAFILVLEDSGYLARAAFMMDRIMGGVGLHGRAFIPLLSSYACAIPGILSTRTIANPRDRLATILVAPLTTCSARLPVYTLLVGAFVPDRPFLGPFRTQGAVLFALYLLGTLAPLTMAWVFRRTVLKGPKPTLLMELPTYKMPSLRGVVLGLVERTKIFLRRAGTVILSLSVLVWFLSSYPKVPAQGQQNQASVMPAIHSSYAGTLGHAVEPLLRPLGFDWRVGIALIPGFAAREVMVSALATVYAIEGDEATVESALSERLAASWTLATALSLMVWYVFAPQCLSTLAVVRRETNSWRWSIFLLVYMTALAYLASFLTYRLVSGFGWGG
ncbi:MAG: ferrous iron transport protein B [Bdellovibrionales bacterium]|nr:ferrous iron transport protein B [Bdellovibrionales bacterium]